jgi:hypothetical protein
MIAVEVGEEERVALMQEWFDKAVRWQRDAGIALFK